MSEKTGISWTDATWNPYIGCSKLTDGCDNCYAIKEARRLSFNEKIKAYHGKDIVHRGPDGKLNWSGNIFRNSDKSFYLPNKIKKTKTFFVDSMSDLFHKKMTDDQIVEAFEIMYKNKQHTFQVLTKRPARMRRMVRKGLISFPPHIWAGVSVCSNNDLRMAVLLADLDATSKFISAEPLIGPLDKLDTAPFQMVIVGGESGRGASIRPMKADWVRDLRDKCLSSRTHFFFKQWGEYDEIGTRVGTDKSGHVLDGAVWQEIPSPVFKRTKNRYHSISATCAALAQEKKVRGGRRIMVSDQTLIDACSAIIDKEIQNFPVNSQKFADQNLEALGLENTASHVNHHAWALSRKTQSKEVFRIRRLLHLTNRGKFALEDVYAKNFIKFHSVGEYRQWALRSSQLLGKQFHQVRVDKDHIYAFWKLDEDERCTLIMAELIETPSSDI